MNINWDTLASTVGTIVREGAPIAEDLAPEYAPAIQIAAKLLTGAANAEPQAKALLATIQSGTDPTAAELAQYATDYDDSYLKLHSDIAAELAKLPA